jgi:tripeptidyl-peptidase I
MFLPQFPSGCPYITCVGGTRNFEPEGKSSVHYVANVAAKFLVVAAYDPRFKTPFTSGGGFSNYFPRPAYQEAAVTKYLTYIGEDHAGLYNASGRGIPDIAAQSQNFSTIWNGTVRPVDGTSAATPLAAAIFVLVNDALISAGKPPMGFLNVSNSTNVVRVAH